MIRLALLSGDKFAPVARDRGKRPTFEVYGSTLDCGFGGRFGGGF